MRPLSVPMTLLPPHATADRIGPRERMSCLGMVVGLELRNVVAKYPFESSHRFPGSSRIVATETIRV
jgi:hypothetical protein